MNGTFWLTVDNSIQLTSEQLRTIYIEDPDPMLYEALEDEKTTGISSLYLNSLADLNLPHGSQTPEIFKQSSRLEMQKPRFGTALRALIQHPNIFQTTRIDGKKIEGCLVGIETIESMKGRKYVIELAQLGEQGYLRFRRADDDVRWPDYELWAFEK
jgi:hypothetical protein